MWGGDLVYLAQILENAVQQLIELRRVLQTGRDQLDLLRDINRGLNDSLNLARTTFPNIDPGIYKDLDSLNKAIGHIRRLYGIVSDSPNRQLYQDTDQIAAEALNLNNEIYRYTQEVDEIGEQVKSFSHQVSPGGAQKLTAQTLGIMLHVMNQNLRAQSTGLKIQAQTLALENKKDKDSTRQYLETASTLRSALKADQMKFQTPRF